MFPFCDVLHDAEQKHKQNSREWALRTGNQVYSIGNSIGATQPFSANYKASSEETENRSLLHLGQVRDLRWKVVYFYQQKDKYLLLGATNFQN